ncbi:hypothetical protein TI39_contig602g00024 [Zymoseptoria brevis]|uniref:Uncharacterized protein n=1 Tax=Zymoseptoria brevis TaxID=1047168 RepID=A0A0F4GHJ8_9PEZI|nr:hypothetical protein TI39_contig602g00024 [Zymoseptoria brevis]
MGSRHLSVGDTLMLSQSAWKIEQAFRYGNKNAPAIFTEVEREANALSDVLKLIAETLHDDDGIVLALAGDETKSSIDEILDYVRDTLAHLTVVVEIYQVVKKTATSAGGFAVERNWRAVVTSHYDAMMWTADGGNIDDLLYVMQMHTDAIRRMTHALQSRSPTRLNNVVLPMAENIRRMHKNPAGKQSQKPQRSKDTKLSLATRPPIPAAPKDFATSPKKIEITPLMLPQSSQSPPKSPLRLFPKLSPPAEADIKLPETTFVPTKSPGQGHKAKRSARIWEQSSDRVGDDNFGRQHNETTSTDNRPDSGIYQPSPKALPKASLNGSAVTPTHCHSRRTILARPESDTLPSPCNSDNGQLVISQPAPRSPTLAVQPDGQLLPIRNGPLTPKPLKPSCSDEPHRNRTLALLPAVSPPRALEKQDFLRQLCRNAIILCDVGCRLVEVARENDAADPRHNVDRLAASQESRLCVIRKRENRKFEPVRMITSIWCISQDGQTRLQQELSESEETVPYCSYSEPEKVSIQPAGSRVHLRYHDKTWGAPLTAVKNTNWVNYYFYSESDAMAFQSAVFGRTLIGSYRTIKTTVAHEGFKGVFSFEEQFSAGEVLRLWEDDGVSTPGASGGIFALMHTRTNFGDGNWAKWWINNSRQPIKVKDDGARHAKVKRMHVSVPKTGSAPRRMRTLPDGQSFLELASPASSVSGVRIEFKSEEERTSFVSAAQRAQERSLNLPDLTW